MTAKDEQKCPICRGELSEETLKKYYFVEAGPWGDISSMNALQPVTVRQCDTCRFVALFSDKRF